ncbi:MAG: hypothetical protein JST01_03445 [Cyanobacteria bacterium SZAS TMP-1]|nr:hypothetical protein [Cyanobacteria bacterium SZAS TMP-1]
MKTLELYINSQAGGYHSFIVVEGTRRYQLENNFSVQSVDEMLKHAEGLIESNTGYEPRLRVYDPGHKMVKGGDGITWVTQKQLRLWTMPRGMREPQPNEDILGRALGGMAQAATA